MKKFLRKVYNMIPAALFGIWASFKNTRFLVFVIIGKQKSRSQDETKDNYETAFSRSLDLFRARHRRLMVIKNRFAWSNTFEVDKDFLKVHYDHLKAAMSQQEVSKAKILEVGSGYGRTILPLAAALADCHFYGLEYSEAGVSALKDYRKRYLDEIKEIARSVTPEVGNLSNVKSVIQGDAKKMPYKDGEFDYAYTNLVLEQIPDPEDLKMIFGEVSRVVKKGCFFLEPWREANNIFGASYLKYNNYFRERMSILDQFGFSEKKFVRLDFYHNLKFKIGYVACKK